MRIDPRKTWRLVEARLAREREARRRWNLEVVLAGLKAAGEAGRWGARRRYSLFAPTSHPPGASTGTCTTRPPSRRWCSLR